MSDRKARPLDYARPAGAPRRWWLDRRVGWLIAAGLAVAVGLFLRLPACRPPIDDSNQGESASHLHQIGLAVMLFWNDYGDHCPPSLADLVADEYLTADLLVCPGSGDTPATLPSSVPTTPEATAALVVPGHLSYVYCGHSDWIGSRLVPDAILAYEPSGNGWGSNVLFADDRVECVPAARAARLIAAAAATTRPVSAATVP